MKNSFFEARVDFFYKTAMALVVVVLFLGPILHTLKLLRYGNYVGALFFYTTFPLTSLLFFLSFFVGRRLMIILPDGIATCILLLLVWGGGTTFVYGGEWDDILGNLIRVVFVFVCYQTTRYYARGHGLQSVPRMLSLWGGGGVLIAVIIVYSVGVFTSSPVYLGLGTAPAIFSLAYVLTSENKYKNIFTIFILLLFFLGGKRGYMIAAFAVLAVNFVLSWHITYLRILKWFVAGLILSVLIYFFVALGLNNYLPPQLVKRFNVSSLDGSGVDVRKLTSGRNLEVDAVIETWKEDPVSAFTGLGFGATFVNEAGNRDSTVHISPVAMAFIFGVPIATIVLFSVWLQILRSIVRLRRASVHERFWCLASVGFLFSTFSVFTFLQSSGLWVSLGCLSGQLQLLREREEGRFYGH